MSEKRKPKLQIAQDEAQKAVNKTNEKIEELGYITGALYDKLSEIQDIFDTIRNVPSEKKLEYEELKRLRLDWKQQVERIEKNFDEAVIKNAGAGAVGAGVGVAVAAMGPTAAMGVATTFGVASTGTAISTLSGAAATNAALAWLGGGALAANGGGMVAGHAFLAMLGPAGFAIAGVALLASGILFWKSASDKKHLEDVFTIISNRDVKSYDLAIVELNERIQHIIDESSKLAKAINTIKEFGTDYNAMSEDQQYELGAYVNLMNASTCLLVNPIQGLQPKYTQEDYSRYVSWKSQRAYRKFYERYENPIIALSNLLYKISINDRDKQLLWKALRNNKSFLESMNVSKKEFEISIMETVLEALDYKYNEKQ